MDDTPWQRLLRYVTTRAPQFCIAPIPPEQLRDLYESAPLPIPRVVHELFSALGEENEIYHPFGQGYIVSVSQFLEDREYQCLAERFFRVAIVYDPQQVGAGDLYVDLEQTNGYDAPLVIIGTSWRGQLSRPGGHTVLSRAMWSAFTELQLNRAAFRGRVSEHLSEPELLLEYAVAMERLAERMKLTNALDSGRPDLQFYMGEDFSLLFDGVGPGVDPSRLLTLRLGTQDARQFLELVDILHTWMPPLSIVRPKSLASL